MDCKDGPPVKERREKTIRTPSREEVKTMVALALEQGILATFSHHYFTFDGKTYLEKTEGPIGLKLSGAVGKVVMLWWSRVFKELLARATSDLPGIQELYMHSIYVDDNNILMEALSLGTRLEGQFFLVKEELVE